MQVAYKVSEFNRIRKWNLFLHEIAPTRETRVLDVGFSEKEYSANDNYIEKHYPYPEMLTALGVNAPKEFKRKYTKVTALCYDGSVFPFEDKSFDVCWSNAVLEHVGDRGKQIFFLKEIKRVAKRRLITTPNSHFPFEVHTRTPFLHYLPKSVFDKYLYSVRKAWATGEYMHLLSINELRRLLRDAGIIQYRIFKNRIVGFSLDFVII